MAISASPKVTVGMPVLNGGELFERALQSILNQSYQDIEILISNNASTDQTGGVCERYALLDSRIRYVQQRETIPCLQHYEYLVKEARGEYFFWAPHDDWWDKDFIVNAITALDSSPSAVAAMGRVQYRQPDGGLLWEDKPPYGLDGADVMQRLRHYFSVPITDMLYYAVVRTNVLKRAPFVTSICPEKGIILYMIISGAICDVEGMIYNNQLAQKSEKQVLEVFGLPNWNLRYEAQVFKTGIKTLWEELPLLDFIRIFPRYILSGNWHKMPFRWIKRLIFQP